jgi:hypothetical protein
MRLLRGKTLYNANDNDVRVLEQAGERKAMQVGELRRMRKTAESESRT